MEETCSFPAPKRLLNCRAMDVCRIVLLNFVFVFPCISALAQAVVEGRVELPKSHSAPVVAKRYEIVTRGGALSTQPPLAVVYLAGSFSKVRSPSTKQI